jgi:guanylate kinase
MHSDKALIIIIFGASGSGKSTLLKELRKISNHISINQKATTRPPKKDDSDEIKCVNVVDDETYPYIYKIYGYEYGINKKQIEDAINKDQDHLIICNDIPIIRKIKGDYGERVKAIYISCDAQLEYIEQMLKSLGLPDDQVNLRIAGIEDRKKLYNDNCELFDGVIHNNLKDPLCKLLKQFDKLFANIINDNSYN